MSNRVLIRRVVVGAAALALTSTVVVGGVSSPPPAHAAGVAKTLSPVKTMRMDGSPPACPNNGSSLTPERTYPTNGVYRGVIMCHGDWGGDEFYMQLVDLSQGASIRVVSHPTSGNNPLGTRDTKFDKHTTDEWYAGMASYNPAQPVSDLYSVTNAGWFKAPLSAATNELVFPEIKGYGVMSLGFAYNAPVTAPGDETTLADWNATKKVLKLSGWPATSQWASTGSYPESGGNYYNNTTDVTSLPSPIGSGVTMDAVVGFSASSHDQTVQDYHTYVGTNGRTVYILATNEQFTRPQIVDLFAAFGVSSVKLVQLDGGGSTQMTTRAGGDIDSFPDVPDRRVPEVLAVYEGNKPDPNGGLSVGDLNHDGRGDLVARAADGKIYRYLNSGNLSNLYPTGVLVGPGWEGMSWWGVDDVDGDGWDDIVARTYAGTLLLYRNSHNLSNLFPSSAVIGSGWNMFKFITIGNVNPGDNHADIIAMKPDGTLWRYMNSGSVASPYSTGVQIQTGTNWSTNNRLRLGDINHDGKDDLLATTPDGTLWSLVNTMTGPSGAFSTSVARAIGGGWNTINRFAMDDVTGDGVEDILGTGSASPNNLYRYTNTWPIVGGEPFQNPFQAPVTIGPGWAESLYY